MTVLWWRTRKDARATDVVEALKTVDSDDADDVTIQRPDLADADGAASDPAHTDDEGAESLRACDADGARRAQVSDDRVTDPAPPSRWLRIAAVVLPALALILASAAGYIKWQHESIRDARAAAAESAQAAKASTIAMLSYDADTVQTQLRAARDLLTGSFKDSYASLINDVVIPGAKQKHISAAASVPAVASVSADSHKAVAIVFVNQTITMTDGAPTDTASAVRVTMDKVDGHWLVCGFDPI